MKLLKCFLGAFLGALGFLLGLAMTQEFLFLPLIEWIMKIRGTFPLEGEELGSENVFISFGILFPLFYLLSFGAIYKFLSAPPPKSAPLDSSEEKR
jgi:hypothetical protein